MNDNTPYIVSAVSYDNFIELFLNGVLGSQTVGVNTGTWSNPPSRPPGQLDKWRIGDPTSGNANPAPLYIAEIALFNRTLDSGEREALERYLAKKYGIIIGDACV
jgi:hypothetical protein